MKIAHLTTVDLSLRFLLLPQMEAAAALGEVLGISAPGPYGVELAERGIRHVPLPGSTRGVDLVGDLRAAWWLWRILRRERPDLLHTHNPKPGVYGRIVGRLAGVPMVVNTVHGLYATDADPLWKRLVVYGLEGVASRFSDAELVQNPEDLDLLTRLRLVAPSKLHLLGNGVDLERFNPETARTARASVRDELGLSDDRVVVGTVGRLVEEKGYLELFEAMERLEERFVLVVVGPDDPDKPDALGRDAVARAERIGVRFLGMRRDVERLYGGFDLFVLASHREGFPRAAMEAAASGLPIVATDIRGCRQVVDHGRNGLLVPLGDPEALAEAVHALGSDPEKRRRMGAASAEKARREFDERRVVEKVIDTYRQVARRKGLEWAMGIGGDTLFRPARRRDVAAIAELHRRGITDGFLSSLGAGFLRELYGFLVDWGDGRVVVAEQAGAVIGFVAGVKDIKSLYRAFLKRRALPAGLSALPKMVRPSTVRRMWETLRYGMEGGGEQAELLSLAVAPNRRGAGVGRRLVEELMAWATEQRLGSMRVVVGADNRAAVAVYRRTGFTDPSPISVHGGRPSLCLTWKR